MTREAVLSPEQNEMEIVRPRGCGRLFNYLMDYKHRSAIEEMGAEFDGKLVLDICCGSGIDAEYLAERGAKLFVLDYDFEGVKRTVERARRFGFKVFPVVGDAQCLPFKEGVFYMSFVNDGLHHLPEPLKGVEELCRTASEVVVVMEPAFSWLTRLAVRLNLSVDYEEDDNNYVYRFTASELEGQASDSGFEGFKSSRYLLWHPHMPPRWFNLFEGSGMFYFFLLCFKVTNALIGGSLGNKISFAAFKKG